MSIKSLIQKIDYQIEVSVCEHENAYTLMRRKAFAMQHFVNTVLREHKNLLIDLDTEFDSDEKEIPNSNFCIKLVPKNKKYARQHIEIVSRQNNRVDLVVTNLGEYEKTVCICFALENLNSFISDYKLYIVDLGGLVDSDFPVNGTFIEIMNYIFKVYFIDAHSEE